MNSGGSISPQFELIQGLLDTAVWQWARAPLVAKSDCVFVQALQRGGWRQLEGDRLAFQCLVCCDRVWKVDNGGSY